MDSIINRNLLLEKLRSLGYLDDDVDDIAKEMVCVINSIPPEPSVPLEVIEDIKEEIKEEADFMCGTESNRLNGQSGVLYDVLKIIDEHLEA